MKWLKNLFKMGLGKGFRIGWSNGKMFNPKYQERKSAMYDLLHPKKKIKKEG